MHHHTLYLHIRSHVSQALFFLDILNNSTIPKVDPSKNVRQVVKNSSKTDHMSSTFDVLSENAMISKHSCFWKSLENTVNTSMIVFTKPCKFMMYFAKHWKPLHLLMFLQLKISTFWKASNSDSRSGTSVELFKAAYENLEVGRKYTVPSKKASPNRGKTSSFWKKAWRRRFKLIFGSPNQANSCISGSADLRNCWVIQNIKEKKGLQLHGIM